MSDIILKIDDKEVRAKDGMTILEAAQEVGISIPTLCYHEGLTPYGACRLCTVELVKGQRSRLVTSCVYPVEDGLVVKTKSAPVVRLRRMLLEFMLALSPGAEAILNYAREYGVTEPRFEMEPTYCILCGLCVRYCAEIKKKNAVGFIGRGIEREIMFFPDIATKECLDCGECFSLCPTGLIPSNYALARVPGLAFPTSLRG